MFAYSPSIQFTLLSGYPREMDKRSPKKARRSFDEDGDRTMENKDEGPYTSEGVPINWDGTNWRNYKYVLEIVFKRQHLWEVATGVVERDSLTTPEEKAEYDRKNLDIQRILATSMKQEILEQFLGCATGREIWKALCEKYENETVKMHAIRRLTKELWTANFEPHDDLTVHLQRMRNVCRELRSYEHHIDDDLLVELMLESLPPTREFNSLKGSIYYNCDRVIGLDELEELIKFAHLQHDLEEENGANGANDHEEVCRECQDNGCDSQGSEHGTKTPCGMKNKN